MLTTDDFFKIIKLAISEGKAVGIGVYRDGWGDCISYIITQLENKEKEKEND